MSNHKTHAEQPRLPHLRISQPLPGPGLKKQGIVILQFLLLALIETFEYKVTHIGMITGISMVLLVVAGLYLGRPGTQWVNAVNMPLSFAIISLLEIVFVGHAGIHISKLASGIVSVFSAGAPYLIVSVAIGWFGYFIKKRSESHY